ncbi:MAG: ATP-binding domain-containing protein, partial [Thalassotalea sp.]|nr:ATP-binding domain-containing protein [Thalassotalea sp.]
SNLPVSKKHPVDHLTYLTQSRRFDVKGGIGILSQLVIAGESEQSWQLLQAAKDNKVPQLMFIEQNEMINKDDTWFADLVEQYYRPLTHANSIDEAFHLLSKFRFLSATRQGETGVETINQLVESILMPHLFANSYSNNQIYRSINTHSQTKNNALYHTKPIMINENDYSLGFYNGDIGIIWKNKDGHLMAIFEQQDGEFKHILPSRLPQYETVYAMTIHKTQGSEFQHVAMILPSNTDNKLLTRELLYTGITRAKTQITLQSKKPVWFQGVESKVSRHSGIELN